MPYTVSLIGLWLLMTSVFCQTQNNPASSRSVPSSREGDTQLIQQLEADLLKAEKTTDPMVIDRVFAEDYVNLTPTGTGPGKADILRNFREHAGEAPPYSVRQQDLRVFVLNDESAVAAYVKVYVANENKNIAREDTTHMFTKSDGLWKLRISRASPSSHSE